MRQNTPPHRPDLENNPEELMEEINLDGDQQPEDDELEMEEVTLEELEARLGINGSDEEMENEEVEEEEVEEEEETEEEIRERERIAAIRDEAVTTFTKHSAPVFGCGLHPKFDWAVTGSEDDKAYVWNYKTGEILYAITDHNDTVTETHWNHDGSYLATADISGELQVFKMCDHPDDRPIMGQTWEYSMFDMSWLFWHRAANVILAGGDTGEVYVFQIPRGNCKILAGNSSRCEAGQLSHDGKKLFTIYTNGVVKLWDLKCAEVIMEVNVDHPLGLEEISHAAVDCEPESPFYVVAEGSGKLLFYTNNGIVNVMEAEHSIECAAFAPASSDLRLLACGSLHGQITVWDYTKYSLRTVCESPVPNDGVLRLKWLNEHTILSATAQGNLNAFDARTGALKFTVTGHRYHIYEFVYKPKENVLLSVSEDNTAKIFNLPPLCN